MKTPVWFSRIGILSDLRITATVLLLFAAAAMALFAAFAPTESFSLRERMKS